MTRFEQFKQVWSNGLKKLLQTKRHNVRSVLCFAMLVWIAVVFFGPEIKLINAPPQNTCTAAVIADYLQIDTQMVDCENPDFSLAGLAAVVDVSESDDDDDAEIIDELKDLVSESRPGLNVRDSPTRFFAVLRNLQLSNKTLSAQRDAMLALYDKIQAPFDFLRVLQSAHEAERDPLKPYKFGNFGKDRYVGTWLTGEKAYSGERYECSATLFSNDLGDFVNFLMGNVCTGALELRCIFNRITYILLVFAASILLGLSIRHGAGSLSPNTHTITCWLGGTCIVIILVLPLITAVHTTKSASQSFAAPGTNKYIGSTHEFGVTDALNLAPLRDLTNQINSIINAPGPSRTSRSTGSIVPPELRCVCNLTAGPCTSNSNQFSDLPCAIREHELRQGAQNLNPYNAQQIINQVNADCENQCSCNNNTNIFMFDLNLGCTDAIDVLYFNDLMPQRQGSLRVGKPFKNLNSVEAGSLLRLGTIPHTHSAECGLEWSESVYAFINTMITPAVHTARTNKIRRDNDEPETTFSDVLPAELLLLVLDALKYSVTLTAFFYLRLVTVPALLLLTLIMYPRKPQKTTGTETLNISF